MTLPITRDDRADGQITPPTNGTIRATTVEDTARPATMTTPGYALGSVASRDGTTIGYR